AVRTLNTRPAARGGPLLRTGGHRDRALRPVGHADPVLRAGGADRGRVGVPAQARVAMRRRSMFALLAAAALVAAPAAAQSHLLVVSGLGGEPRLQEEFHAWS